MSNAALRQPEEIDGDLARGGVGKQLRKAEVEAVIARRDAIINHFDARIAKSGEASVLYTYP